MISVSLLRVVLGVIFLKVIIRLLFYPILDKDAVAKNEGRERNLTQRWFTKIVKDSASYRLVSKGKLE